MNRYEGTKRTDSSRFVRVRRYEKYERPIGLVLSSDPSSLASTGYPERTRSRDFVPRGGVRAPAGAAMAAAAVPVPAETSPARAQIKSRKSLTALRDHKSGVPLWLPVLWSTSWPLPLHFVWLIGISYGR